MTLLSIVPAKSREHRRRISRMARDLNIHYRRWEAVADTVTDLVLLVVMIGTPIACAVLFVGWWLCV